MVVIIDYMGNTGSVKNALSFLGVESVVSNRKKDIEQASHLILPGVGSFGDGMKKLRTLDIIKPLARQVFEKKIPFMGICLGMQLLADIGEEGGEYAGLGWIPGKVQRLKGAKRKYRLPHIGWNDVSFSVEDPILEGIDSPIFYFVHSYFFSPKKNGVVATCDYGEVFPAIIRQDNIWGVQFHPEKSQKSGLALLKNFIDFYA